jgi:hypothetical protein
MPRVVGLISRSKSQPLMGSARAHRGVAGVGGIAPISGRTPYSATKDRYALREMP